MDCRLAKELIALHAGGDLPARDAAELDEHLAGCGDCSAELAEMRRALAAVGRIAEADRAEPLSERFVHDVRRETRARAGAVDRPGLLTRLFGGSLWGPVAAVAVAAVAVIILLNGRPVDPRRDIRLQTGEGTVAWGDLPGDLAICLETPIPLSDWEIPDDPGVVAIMHRPDPDAEPHTYVVDYCGEGRRLSAARGYTWLTQRLRRLTGRAGSTDNLYVAVCLTAGDDPRGRRDAQKALVRQLDPEFNRREGV